jgi:hypothetical protein
MRSLSALLAATVFAGLLGAPADLAQAAPQIKELAKNVYQNLYGIAVDASGVYVTGSTSMMRGFTVAPASGVVGVIPLAGGSVSTLYSASNYAGSGHVVPLGLATNGAGTLYWADPDAGPGTGASLFSASTTGGTPTQFFGTCCGPSVLPGDGIGVALSTTGTLYFSDGTGGRAGYFSPGSSTPVQIGPTRYTPAFLTESWSQATVSGSKLFLADSGQQRGDNGSTNVQVIDDESASVTPAITWIKTNGAGGFHTLSQGVIPNPQGIVAAGGKLYVTSGNTIWTVNATTGAATVLVSSPKFMDLQGIAFYAGFLYVADSQNTYGPFVSGVATATQDLPGVVWRVKP